MGNNAGASAMDLETYVQKIDKDSFGDDDARYRASLAIRSLLNRLETPYETFIRRTWVEPACDVALKIGIDLKLFEALSKDDGKPKSVEDIASATEASEPVLRRVCKHLAGVEAIREINADVYGPTEYSNSLIGPGLKEGVNHQFDGFRHGLYALPEWLRLNNYVLPADDLHCPWQLGTGESTTVWGWLEAVPHRLDSFNQLMVGFESGVKNPLDLYPVKEKLVQDFRVGVLLVDIGGGLGQDLNRFNQNYPVSDARLILQDQKSVISSAQVSAPIEAMAHDFFTEQPIKGADENAIEILAKVRPAMEPECTKILIHDLVIPPTNAVPYATAIDLTMMSLFGAKERTEADWRHVIAEANLKLEKIYSGPGYRESIIEVVREH